MNDRQMAAWARVRERGKMRYIAIMGGSYGLLMFLFMTFVVHRDKLNPVFVALSLVLWIVGGVVFGGAMWFIGEYRYRKAIARGVTQ